MIKWDWYWKLLKQWFFTLLISCFILLGGSFVNAWKFQVIWLDTVNSIYNSQYSLWFLKWWTVNTSYLWYTKSVLALDSNRLFWWATNWKPYFYWPNFQWFFNWYYACDEITENTTSISNCSFISFDWDSKTILKWFFWQVLPWDYAYYNYDYTYSSASCQVIRKDISVCFSSHTVWNSVCFKQTSCYDWCQGWQYACNTWCSDRGGCGWELVDSQNLTNTTFSNIPDSWIGYAPWHALYDWVISWDSQNVSQWNLTWDVMTLDCTNRKAFNWYRANWYKTRMCYSSYLNNQDIYNGAWSVGAFALTWTDILDVWFDTWSYRRYWGTWSGMSYEDWFAYWRKTYEVYKKNSDMDNPFVGVPVSLFTLMWNVDSYWLPYSNGSIIEFCDLSLYSDNELDSVYTWLASSVVCSMSSNEYLDVVVSNQLNPDDWYPWYLGSSINWTITTIWSSWDWITNRAWYHTMPWSSWSSSWVSLDTTTYQDWTTFQNTFFNLFKKSFKYPEWSWNWFLPSYIIIFLCWIIFFRFLRH